MVVVMTDDNHLDIGRVYILKLAILLSEKASKLTNSFFEEMPVGSKMRSLGEEIVHTNIYNERLQSFFFNFESEWLEIIELVNLKLI